MPRTARGLHYEVTDLRAPWLRERQSGRPVVLHHGVGASLGIFAEWMPIVAARHPVARFDMRGFGLSAVPPESHAWSMTELIADLLEVAETAFGAEPVHAMGESIGGTIALAAGLRHPSRFASVAMSNAATRSPAHVVVGLGELLVGMDLTAELPACKLPLLLMMPDRSPFVSLAQASALAELVPQAEIAVFPGARHGLPLSHAKEAAGTLLAFLGRVEAGGLAPPRIARRDG